MLLLLLVALVIGGNIIPPPPPPSSAAGRQAASHYWVMKLEAGVSADAFAGRHEGLVHVGWVDFLPKEDNVHVFSGNLPPARQRDALLREGLVWAEPQVAKRQFTRAMPDPLYENQWHLHGLYASVELDMVDRAINGSGVTIAIVDDGLQHTHPDLSINYDSEHSWDFNGDDADPTPDNPHQGHGTAAAGVAAAARENGHCGRGVASQAKLVGLRTIADAISDVVEAQSLSHNGIGTVDIYSCSWGPADDGRTMEGPGPVVEAVLQANVGLGRGRLGKGSIYVWAAGNGRANGDSCAFDGYASSPYVMAIGSISHEGKQAYYSEGCAALMAVTPSSGDGRGVTTVDLMGAGGYDPTECTASFGGTSSSAPLAAGVVALLLQQYPDFTWRDVKHVIARGAVPIQTNDGSWTINRAGFRHSNSYGFGLLKLPALLQAARAYVPVPRGPFLRYNSGVQVLQGIPYMIPVEVNFTARNTSGITFIEHVMLTASVWHESRGSLGITLTSPSGITSVLATERSKDTAMHYPLQGRWTFTSLKHWGETVVAGTWTINVTDTNPQTTGRGHFNSFQLVVWGY